MWKDFRDLEAYTHSKYQSAVSRIAMTVKNKNVLNHFERRNQERHSALLDKVKNRITGKSFFETLKSYTVQGYCISEKGASLGMRYIAVPGKYLVLHSAGTKSKSLGDQIISYG